MLCMYAHMHMHTPACIHEHTHGTSIHMYMYLYSHMQCYTFAYIHTVSEDYRFVGGNFVFLPSTMPLQYRCFNVSILDDLSFESTEQLSVNLSTNVSRVNLITTSILIEIRDNDTITVGLNQTDFAIVEELQSGGVSFTVCTVLTGRLEKTVVVHLSSQPISSAGKQLVQIGGASI